MMRWKCISDREFLRFRLFGGGKVLFKAGLFFSLEGDDGSLRAVSRNNSVDP